MSSILGQLSRGMEGMPKDLRSMKLPVVFKALRESRDVSAKDPVVSVMGALVEQPVAGKSRPKSNHPQVRNNLVNSFPDMTESQKRFISFTDKTSEIAIGSTFMGGRQKFLQARMKRA